jgi:hypothetical protein
MKLNLDVVPKNLDDAVRILKEAIKDEEEAKQLQDTAGLHFGLGMYLRNNWSLWDTETVLVQWFKENLGIAHADDLSGTILEALAASLRGEEFDAKAHVQRYIEHWKRYGVNPLGNA